MIRRHLHWIIAGVLIVSVTGACLVRTRNPRPAPRGRPVYVVPAEQHEHGKHKEKHQKHRD